MIRLENEFEAFERMRLSDANVICKREFELLFWLRKIKKNQNETTTQEAKKSMQNQKEVTDDTHYSRAGLSESSYLLMVSELVHHYEECENEKETLQVVLDQMGYRVGQRLVERFTRERARFTDTLDVVKFICKDVWMVLFKKQVDNLKTNHRGVFVLQDNNFRWLSRFSGTGGNAETAKKAALHLIYPCGIIKGALSNLDVQCTVHAEVTTLPQCTFQIRLQK